MLIIPLHIETNNIMEKMMKRILSVILVVSSISVLSYEVYAGESVPTMSMAQKPSAGMRPRAQIFKELRETIEKFDQEQKLLTEQIKTEKNDDKLKDLRSRRQALKLERINKISALRVELGQPALKLAGQEERKEGFKELRDLIENFHHEQGLLLEQLKIEKDESKIAVLRNKMLILYKEFRKNTDIKRTQLGLSSETK